MKSKTALYGISLGPGDPDLITVKGLKILQLADRIYFPGSVYKDGSQLSYSLSILEHYNLDIEKCVGFYLEMSLERTQAKESYTKVFKSIQADLAKGMRVAIVAEGDLSTYSSFSYLLEKAKAAAIPVELVPGISSYAAGAALHHEPLCLQNERLLIIPRVPSVAQLLEAIAHHETVVLMKIVSIVPIPEEVLAQHNLKIFYSEKIGTRTSFISTDWSEIKTRAIPYFSLMMIKK
jgi:precorrin-2/cobalt-factor-2 C20-methyltransferase